AGHGADRACTCREYLTAFGRPWVLGADLPRVDQLDPCLFEVLGVAGRQYGAEFPADGRDLRVGDLDGVASVLSPGDDVRVPACGALVKGHYPPPQRIVQQGADGDRQLLSALASGETGDYVVQL